MYENHSYCKMAISAHGGTGHPSRLYMSSDIYLFDSTNQKFHECYEFPTETTCILGPLSLVISKNHEHWRLNKMLEKHINSFEMFI